MGYNLKDDKQVKDHHRPHAGLRTLAENYVGVYRWFGVLALWVCWFVWDSTLKTLSILLPTLTIQFDTETWMLGWIATIVDGASDFVGRNTTFI